MPDEAAAVSSDDTFIRDPDFTSLYANNIRIERSVWDLKLIFGELDQSVLPAGIAARACLHPLPVGALFPIISHSGKASRVGLRTWHGSGYLVTLGDHLASRVLSPVEHARLTRL